MLLTAGFIVFFLGIAFVGGWDSFWNLLPPEWKFPLAHFNSPAEFNSVGLFWEDGIAGSVGFLFMNMGLIMRFYGNKKCSLKEEKLATVNILFMLPLSAVVVGGGGWVAKLCQLNSRYYPFWYSSR